MVEILSGTTAARSVAQQVPTSSQKASNSDAGSTANPIPRDFYLSPVIRFDSEALKVIFEIRDSRSGEVTRQFPPERAVRELEKTAGLGVEAPETQEPNAVTGDRAIAADSGTESAADAGAEQEVNVLI
ncbi:hypothetical protein NUH88_02120 [Nisaea acidiphila]|uniref:Flagellar protein FlaG n=1 Tax=Nisaea acidiphila TaxID=1862145 RepID=A0A9J7AT77_9PROT|nr:hypothetical protein [Nisaea acidiphila]UUX50495.1 hypothetical protein NUH88_02120 [Nisaea acidiphila]